MPYFNWEKHRIHYICQGDGPLLLILPGNTASSKCCQYDLDYFSNRFCTVSLDFLGTGKSERVEVWARDWWDQGARQALALVDELGYSDCIAMGTSGGGVVALTMAAFSPEKVRAVIADSCVSRISDRKIFESIVEDRNRRTEDQARFWEFAQGPDWEQVVDADTDMLTRFMDDGGDWFSNRLADIKCPVLLTASRQDSIFPQITKEICAMSEQIADCRVFLNNEGDHPFMWTSPQDFRILADYFMKDITGANLQV